MNVSALTWSQAQRVISDAKPQAGKLQVLEWLVRADLLLEDAPITGSHFSDESVVRPAFERLGDFLIAVELLERSTQEGVHVACQPGGVFHALFSDPDALEQHCGIIWYTLYSCCRDEFWRRAPKFGG